MGGHSCYFIGGGESIFFGGGNSPINCRGGGAQPHSLYFGGEEEIWGFPFMRLGVLWDGGGGDFV